ncbi:hypothetical protein TPHA_0N01940 [Tetrapisispora phaffii CBS 4417]|uniref:NAD-dependent epimerase/dehydratase domain-containing protein n=1 Tax=Tetrapisispora phaffii (strain ATCC 24235 / CBS 4417 / NBRC 1672 / NRRL Y-8282 / UCD 70-5) TaxID=1071381 RepID=G8C1E7_TETPH|nr:hypothetical protein TPHA_0N01940 [Tetrapisispora phaffii CBS 4417]CCE65975.1 hypothetical protein TPHA_0N01940 [Tetrapisispora phaffii CBS 4417]
MSVFVSGATGFIAQHIVNDLLQQNYKVIGTARSQEKVDKLIKQFGNNKNFSMEIVKDVADINAFDDVFKRRGSEIKYVLHTASPFHFNVTDAEKDLLIPAVNGTKGILSSIKKYAPKNVERFVVTSSFAAVSDLEDQSNSNVIYTEKDWCKLNWQTAQANAVAAYWGSKTFAEKAAWEFLEENKDSVSLKITAINPVYVFGPQLFDEDVTAKLNTSCEFINSLVHSTPETKVEKTCAGNFIDVRDVSKAHILAFQKEETIGKRLILSEGPFGMQDIVNTLNKDFPQLKGKIAPTYEETDVKLNKNFAKINNDETKKILGFKFRTFDETVDDTAKQILRVEKRL